MTWKTVTVLTDTDEGRESLSTIHTTAYYTTMRGGLFQCASSAETAA